MHKRREFDGLEVFGGQRCGQFALLLSRRFGPFFLVQFLGAFNDNLFKNALVVLLTFKAAAWTSLSPGLLANLAAGIFILPFFLFSATAGQLADKYDKAWLTRRIKLLEIAIMLIAGIGFAGHSLSVLLAALFLLGLHSTLFGPVKYALMPQHLRADELIGGNALVEAGTFVAILGGTLLGALLAGRAIAPVWIALLGGFLALLGYLVSRWIPEAPAPVPDLVVNLNPLAETLNNLRFARRDPAIFFALIGISWFWLYGALFLAQFPAYALWLGGDESVVTLLLAVFTLGIGVGSLLCERLSGKKLQLGLVPLGALGLTVFALDFALATPSTATGGGVSWRLLFDLLLLGTFGGFFIVPLYALMQLQSAVEHRARIVAANNILNALFMVAGALGAAVALGQGVSLAELFAFAALGNVLLMLYLHRRQPAYWTAFRDWMRAAPLTG